jgi:ABC-type bacteriocin/lantibiotic exporter with double-glycine peptidase domain
MPILSDLESSASDADPWFLLRRHAGMISVGLCLLLLARVCALALPVATKYLLDNVIAVGRFDRLPTLALVTTAFLIIQSVTALAGMRTFTKIGQSGVSSLQSTLFTHISRLPLEFHDNRRSGEMLSRIMSDVEGVRGLLGAGLADLAGASASTLVALVVMVKISPQLTAMALIFLLVFGLLLWWAARKTRSLSHRYGAERAQVTGRLAESLGGIRVTKAYCAEAAECAALHAGFKQQGGIMLKIMNLHSLANAQSLALFGFANVLFFCLGARQINANTMTIGSFILFVTVSNTLSSFTFQIVSSSRQINEAIAGLQRSREILSMQREDVSSSRVVTVSHLRGELRFDNVTFKYSSGQKVLDKISFVAKPGTMTAIVGSSGSGKSTIANLVAGFYSPSSGKVYVDGVDLETVVLSSYRRHLGLVLQEPFLFDGTIQENISFSRPGAPVERGREAARIAYVDEFAEELEHGYQTMIGERGVKLSAGQRQRISLARAVLASPRILILDEATSNLDSESETIIQEALTRITRDLTAIVIAHRMSTIRDADQILVLEEGRIAEKGTHASLWAARGRYFELCKKQQSNDSDKDESGAGVGECPSTGVCLQASTNAIADNS